MKWLLDSREYGLRNIKLMTEFDSCWLSKYLVETLLIDSDSSSWKESAMSIRVSLWIEWWRKS